jgi:simple sugar transport system substrate-binding protein
VVKVRGLAWFERMRTGIRRFAARTGVDATMTAARDASPRKQAAIIRRLIMRRPDAITVVPNNPAALERVLARARRAGIVVVTHEASNQRNTDVDIEPFENRAFGAHLMDKLASCMGGSGAYVAFVGHRSAQSHREWVRGAEARAKARFPGIRRIGGTLESLENPNVAYRKAKAVLARNPDIGGFEGSSAEDVAGIGRAVREAGRRDTTCVMGTSTPKTVGSLLTDGSVDRIFLWDPALAGQAQDKLALRLLEGRRVGPGLNLRLRGYRNLKRIAGSPHGLHGSAWIDIDRENAGKFPF